MGVDCVHGILASVCSVCARAWCCGGGPSMALGEVRGRLSVEHSHEVGSCMCSLWRLSLV